CQHRYGTPFTF
nr:immunoglobulin light chain junction region [Macaca mulatta]MOV93212.1 immunoglobulin light chain junction region [Macaca mulatta]